MLSPDMFRDNRVLASGGGFEVLHERQLIIFDLRDVDAELKEICSTHPDDVRGLIYYTLRQHYKTAPALLSAMLAFPKDVLTIRQPEGIAA